MLEKGDYLEMPGGGGLESEQVCDERSLLTLFISQTLFIVWKQSPRVERGVHMPSITIITIPLIGLYSVLVLHDVQLVIKSRAGEGNAPNKKVVKNTDWLKHCALH